MKDDRRNLLKDRRKDKSYLLECKGECDVNRIPCLAQSEHGFGCTRTEHHKGNHVACSFEEHDLEVWG